MSYRGLKIIQLIAYMMVFAEVCVESALELPFSVMGPTFLIGFAFICVSHLIARRKYPQWKGFAWWLPWKVMVLVILIAFAVVFVSDYHNLHYRGLYVSSIPIFFGVLANVIYDVHCSIKYEMDRFSSIEELFGEYPEAKCKIRKSVI